MQYFTRVLPIVMMMATVGCQHCGILEKRRSELNCPTDIRQKVPWCAGEDAVFYCPCGPDREFYGCKPTCWGIWPTPGAEWRDAYCGPPTPDYDHQTIDHQTIDQGLVELPDPAEPQASDVDKEIILSSPTSEENEELPEQGDKPVEDTPPVFPELDEAAGEQEELQGDPPLDSNSIDETLKHEVRQNSRQASYQSLKPRNNSGGEAPTNSQNRASQLAATYSKQRESGEQKQPVFTPPQGEKQKCVMQFKSNLRMFTGSQSKPAVRDITQNANEAAVTSSKVTVTPGLVVGSP